MAAAVGDPIKLLAKASAEARCPECNQKGMFEDILYLKQVDQLVKERCALKYALWQCDCCNPFDAVIVATGSCWQLNQTGMPQQTLSLEQEDQRVKAW